MEPRDLEGAVREWEEALGPDRVRTDEATLDRYGRTTQASAARPVAVLRARDRDEVCAVVRVAGRHGVPLYPISRGKNWGYGDACPPTEGQAVLDLSDMNRIVEVDERLAYAVIEPGVTQAQLHEHLASRRLRLWIPCSGSAPDASVVGNALERGLGHTPPGDNFLATCGMEVVLADGSVVHTGFGHFPGSRVSHTLRWGVGPALDGLFSQSNLGVVTRVGIWLTPQPEHTTAFLFGLEEPHTLAELVDRLRPLRLDGTLPNAVHISNDLRAFSYRNRHPDLARGEVAPLTPEAIRRLRAEHNHWSWNALGALHGSRAQVRASARRLKRAVSDIGDLTLVTPRMLEVVDRVAAPLAWLGSKRAQNTRLTVALARPGLGVLRGIPTDSGLPSTRWRVRQVRSPDRLDPLDNDCGLYWVAPLCPAIGSEVERLTGLVASTLRRHGFDPLMTVTLVNGRAVGVPTSISFDRSLPEEARRARDCKDDLLETVLAEGYVPYRAGIGDMDRLDPAGSRHWALVREIKEALDPDGVLAPGRYAPWQMNRPLQPAAAGEES